MELWRVALPLLGWVLRPGCCSLTGPETVSGYVGGSLSLSCRYGEAYAENPKFWCREGLVPHFCALNSKSGGRKEADRFFMEDDKENHCLNVTMVQLRLEDAGDYQCGIERSLRFTIRHYVKVIVFPAPTLGPEENLSTPGQPELDPSVAPAGIATSSPDPGPTGASQRTELSIWICGIVLLLLLLALVVLVVMSRNRETGSCLPRRKRKNLSYRVSAHTTAGHGTEGPVPGHPADAAELEPYMITQLRPKNSDREAHPQEKALEKREEVSYAMLVLSEQAEQALYGNVAPHGHVLPQPPAQEAVYAKVKK